MNIGILGFTRIFAGDTNSENAFTKGLKILDSASIWDQQKCSKTM